jgi:hypothetical protein
MVYAIPHKRGWTCFHCGETFETFGSARDHFGQSPAAEPGCSIRVKYGDERGLQMDLRKAENERDEWRVRAIALRCGADEHDAAARWRAQHNMRYEKPLEATDV